MLSHFLISELFAFMLIFCRLGSALMFLPGFGEAYVAPRIRLFLAVLFSITLAPVIPGIPPVPATTFGLLQLVAGEIIIGLFFGGLTRMMIAAMDIAGTVIAYMSSLSSALTQGIASFQGQDSSLGNLMSFTMVVLLFVTDLHHLMLRGLANSYLVFLPGKFPMVEDFANHATHIMSGAFQTAMQLAAPNIVIGTMLYLGGGVLARLMPTMQIFFIIIAPALLLNFFILMVTFSGIMLWYLDYFQDTLGTFLPQ